MKNTGKFFIFTLAFIQVCISFQSDIFAQSKKRAVKSTKKTTSTRSKLSSPTAGIVEDTLRANLSTRAGRVPSGTGSSTSSTPVDEDSAAQLLADNLQACIQSQCDGDVPFEKCFKSGQAEYLVRINTTCKAMYDGASSDVVRVKAMNLLNTKIKGYFNESCSSAGGKVSGNDCKVDICYFAKGGEGKNAREVKRCNSYKIGQSFTCSATTFGLNDQDLEYNEGLSSTDIATLVQSGMGILNGAITTTMSAIDAAQASKELRLKSNVIGRNCVCDWSFDTNTLTCSSSSCKETWTKCGTEGKAKECKGDNKKVDSYGVYYLVADNTNYIPLDSNNLCSKIKVGSDSVTNMSCQIEIPELTEVARLEKEAELYKKYTDFNKLKLNDNINNIVNVATQQAAFAQFGNDIGLSTQTNEIDCGVPVGVVMGNSLGQLVVDYNKNNPSSKVTSSCQVSNNGLYVCKRDSSNCMNAVFKNGTYIATNSTTPDIGNVGNAVNTLTTSLANANLSTNNYSSAVSEYNEMVKSANEKKNELEELKNRKEDGLSNAIASGTATLVQQGAAMTTTLVSAANNKGVMSGACYLGDPQNGGVYFASDGQSKKLTWKM